MAENQVQETERGHMWRLRSHGESRSEKGLMWGQIVQEVEEGPLYLLVLAPKREVNFFFACCVAIAAGDIQVDS